jgi:hypothetical protein
VTTPSHLVFQALPVFNSDNTGIIIDNVELSTVPEPSTLGMMLVGLASLVVRLSKLRQTKSKDAVRA